MSQKLLTMIAIALLFRGTAFAQDEETVEAQAPAMPEEPEDQVQKEEEPSGPAEGPGSRIPQFEASPANPVTVDEIEGADTYEKQLQLRERDLSYFSEGSETFSS